MATTYYDEKAPAENNYIINHYRMKRLGGKFLLTTDCGSWALLDKKEYDLLIRHDIPTSLFKLLEDKCVILTERNTESLLRRQHNRLNFLFSGVTLHIIIPTLRCNHKCIYCHSSAATTEDKKKDMDSDTAKRTLEFIFQTPAKEFTIEFQGGDSLMNFDMFKYLVTKAKEIGKEKGKKVAFALVTNLTLMTDEYLEWIIKEKVSICTSLDGPKHIHDSNRKYETGKGTYDDVVMWLDKIKKMDGTAAALMVTTKHSIGFHKEIIDEYVKRGMRNIQVKPLNRLGFAEKTWNDIGYSVDEFIDFWKSSVDYLIELNKKGIFIKERYVAIILNKILTEKDPSFLDFRSPCGIAIGQLAYDYNGDIYSCDEGRNFGLFKLGNVKTDKYDEVTSGEQAQALVSLSTLESFACDGCVYKPYCGTCPVLNYAEQNNMIPKLASNSKCKIHKAQLDYVFEKLLQKDTRDVMFSWHDNRPSGRHHHHIKDATR